MLRRQFLRQSRTISQLSPSARRTQPSSSFSNIRQHATPQLTTTYSPRIWQRFQSTEAARTSADPSSSVPPPEKPPQDGGKTTDAPVAEENPLQKELDAKTKEVITLKDQYLRSVADFRNLQERTKRDMESARQFAIQRFAADLLDSIDNLDRALQTVPAESLKEPAQPAAAAAGSEGESISTHAKDLQNLHSGLKMTEDILMSTLRKHGLERFDPLEVGKERRFDPTKDEATFFMKVEGKEDGEVFHTQSKGFTLNGRVIRAAKVGVVKNS